MKNTNHVVLQPSAGIYKSEVNLEALRGAAALIVVWSHCIVFSDALNPGYHIGGWAASEPPARISVFLFFVLSGFVIGISNKQPLEGKSIGIYLKKRLLRIYPIYFLVMVLTLAVSKEYPITTIIANFSFLQVAFADVIWENSPIWSLNYEVLYYLLFIPISFLRVNYFLILFLIVGIGMVNNWFFPSSLLLSSYSFGLATWVIGLMIARYTRNTPIKAVQYKVLLGAILVLCSFRYFNVLDTIFLKLTRALVGTRLEYAGERGYQAMVNFFDFSYVPYFILFILLFTNKNFRFKPVITAILLLLPFTTFGYMYKHRFEIDLAPFVQPGCFYLAGLFLIYYPATGLEYVSQHVINALVKIGSISYGLYIVHMPLLVLIGKISWMAGSTSTYLVRIGLLIIIALFLSYLLEHKFQPWVRAYLHPLLHPAARTS